MISRKESSKYESSHQKVWQSALREVGKRKKQKKKEKRPEKAKCNVAAIKKTMPIKLEEGWSKPNVWIWKGRGGETIGALYYFCV